MSEGDHRVSTLLGSIQRYAVSGIELDEATVGERLRHRCATSAESTFDRVPRTTNAYLRTGAPTTQE